MDTAIKPYSLSETMELGKCLAASGYFSDAKQAQQAVVKVLAGREIGFGPIASMTGIYIVKGRVSLGANLMAAAVKRSPAYDYRVKTHTTSTCEIVFFQGDQEIGRSTFTIEDAKAAGLTTGPNSHSWKRYPRNMLFARTISNGVKWFCPDVFYGAPVYIPEELGAEIDGETGEIVDGKIIEPEAEETALAIEPEHSPTQKPSAQQATDKLHGQGLDWDTVPGNGPELHSDFDAIPDIEALALGDEFNTAAVKDLGYNHARHVINALDLELQVGWGQRFTKSHLWKTLEAHQEAKEAEDEFDEKVLAESLGAPAG